MSFDRLAPDPATLKTGDLIWPRADSQHVFFGADDPNSLMGTWLRNRVAEVAKAIKKTVEEEKEKIQNVVKEFERDVWVGHVAMIEVVKGVPWVVDATPKRSHPAQPFSQGVATQPYTAFLEDAAHLKSHIWQARVKNLSDENAQRMVKAAKQHLGKPYSISPFHFESLLSFYCSKLVWYAARDGAACVLHGTTDGNPWVTPWDLMQSEALQMIYEPPNKPYLS